MFEIVRQSNDIVDEQNKENVGTTNVISAALSEKEMQAVGNGDYLPGKNIKHLFQTIVLFFINILIFLSIQIE